MFDEILEIQAAISSCERGPAAPGEIGLAVDHIFFKVNYCCPYCARRHIQKGRQPGTIESMKKDGGIVVEAKCNQALGVKVQPYR